LLCITTKYMSLNFYRPNCDLSDLLLKNWQQWQSWQNDNAAKSYHFNREHQLVSGSHHTLLCLYNLVSSTCLPHIAQTPAQRNTFKKFLSTKLQTCKPPNRSATKNNSTFGISTSVTVLGILVYLLLAYDAFGISIRSPPASRKENLDKIMKFKT
jgi:hypothetical protein